MSSLLWDSAERLATFLGGSTSRQGLQPVLGTEPLSLPTAILPPLIYYVALVFLPPVSTTSKATKTLINIVRNGLGLTAAILFFRLPLKYHLPQSIGLTYQLALVGLYGGCRVVDAFFITRYLFGHIPRRVRYKHADRVETPNVAEVLKTHPSASDSPARQSAEGNTTGERNPASKTTSISASDLIENVVRRGSSAATDSYFLLQRTITGPKMQPVLETATTEEGWPTTLLGRMEWALELELSMRGAGWTWTTADVRHTRKTWLPTIQNRLHSIFIRVIPTLAICVIIIRSIHTTYLEPNITSHQIHAKTSAPTTTQPSLFDTYLPIPIQLFLTATLGTFLLSAFSLAHSFSAILLSPLAPHPLSYFPALYTTRAWAITSVRNFWSYAWHRLFARLFLVYGSWPGEYLERLITGKGNHEPADVGKVLGAFICSAFVHSFASWTVLGGDWTQALGEAKFFTLNGIAVVIEEAVKREVLRRRRRRRRNKQKKQEKKKSQRAADSDVGIDLEDEDEDDAEDDDDCRYYDPWIGKVWWITVLVVSGRQFCRGWVESGLVREMAGK